MIPGTILYVYFGSVASDISMIVSGEAVGSSNWLLYVGLGATLVLTVLITRFATKALNAELDEAAA